jgi:hypothetical protein
MGSLGIVIKTTNGGTTWTRLSTGTTNNLYSGFFTDLSTGYAVGFGGTILKTSNGGVVSVEEAASRESIYGIYPNPAINKITISGNNCFTGETMIKVFNINGECLILKKFQNQNNIELDVGMLPKGIYLVTIQTRMGIETQKLVLL